MSLFKGLFIGILVTRIAFAQDTLQATGSVEYFAVAGHKPTTITSTGGGGGYASSGAPSQVFVGSTRLKRFTGELTYGKWSATVSHYEYDFCSYHNLHDTYLAYSDKGARYRVGRFTAPIGIANWEDQWYSGFVWLPWIEKLSFADNMALDGTNAGVEADVPLKGVRVQAALMDAAANNDRPFAKALDRGVLRLESQRGNLILGVGGYGDLKHQGRDSRMLGIDFRYTIPQWIFKGEVLDFKSPVDRTTGSWVSVAHRPKGWQDVTLLARYETSHRSSFPYADQILTTLGSRIRLPWDVSLDVNYSWGPNMNKLIIGGGWAAMVSKTIRF